LDKDFLDINEASQFLNISHSTMYRWIREGRIKGLKVGKNWRFTRTTLMKFIESSNLDSESIESLLEKGKNVFYDQSGNNKYFFLNPLLFSGSLACETEKLALELWEHIIIKALNDEALEISLIPMLHEFKVIFRIKGKRFEIASFSQKIYEPINRMIKKIFNMNISNSTFPQRVMIEIELNVYKIPIWLTTFPTLCGDRILINLQSPSNLRVSKEDLNCLGFNSDEMEKVKSILDKKRGIIFICGPGGSGKTSTALASIHYLKKTSKSLLDIHTLEYPVGHLLDGICQTEIDPFGKMNTYMALESLYFFQKPDVICISGINDFYTARLITDMAIGGQMIIVQLHTMDMASALLEVKEVGIDPYLLSITFSGAISQRLVKKICGGCKKKIDITSELYNKSKNYIDNIEEFNLYYGAGCELCNGTGFSGRMAIYEIVPPSDFIIDMINNKLTDAEEVRKELRKSGYMSLRENAVKKALEGVITLEEALRCI